MLKRLSILLASLLGLLVLLAAGILISTHIGIRRIQPPLPSLDTVRAAVDAASGGPVRVGWFNTASQALPRWGVLGTADPHPEKPYRLCHSVFVLEWADGRILLVDAGMTRSQAASFGAFGEWVGAEPIEVHTTAAEHLGSRAARVAGVVFTHLHVDHVDGVRLLCETGASAKVVVPMTAEQAGNANYTTSPVADLVRSLDCLDVAEAARGQLVPMQGFPGVYLIAAGGHTPGSQLVLAVVDGDEGRRAVIFAGDIVNNYDGIEYDVGKPALYSALIVPEATERLGEVRRFLRTLRDEAGVEVLVSHDQYALEKSSIAVDWEGAR